MSFWPLPTILCDQLQAAAARGPLLEPGGGGGGLARMLERLALRVVLIDRSGEALAAAGAGLPRIVGDLLQLPVRAGTVGAVVLGNVARHVPLQRRPDMAREAARVLLPGGVLVVLEDDPRGRSPSEDNYRAALELLALADPRRGTALPPSEVREPIALELGEPIAVGKGENTLTVRHPLEPVRWLETGAHPAVPRERVARLRRAIERDGVAYGRFWFQVYRKRTAPCAPPTSRP